MTKRHATARKKLLAGRDYGSKTRPRFYEAVLSVCLPGHPVWLRTIGAD